MPSQKRTNATPPPCDDATWALMHALPDAAILIHTNGIICAVNEAAAKNLKTTTDDLAGISLYDAFPPDSVSEQKRRIDEVIKSGKPLRTEGVREGKRIDYSIYPIFDDEGTKVTRLVVVTRDITEYRRVKEERQRLLKQVKEQALIFNGILSSSGDRIYVFDRDMRYTYVNLPGARAFGMAPKDIIGKTLKELSLPMEPMRRVIALAEMVFATGRPQTEELQWNSADGETLFYELIHTPIFNTRGEVESIVSTFRNITERKRAEEAVAESEQKYRDLVENARNIIITMDTAGIITFINEYGARFFGYTVDELIGKDVMIVIPEIESTGRHITPIIDDILAHPDKHPINVNENVTKDGRRVWVNWVNKILTNAEGRHIGHLAIGNDVTEQKRAEENAESLAKFPEENPNPVMRLNAKGEILYANKPGQKLLDDWDGTMGGAAPQPLRDATIEALSRQIHKTIEVETNSRIFEFLVISITDAGYVNAYGRDVTERKRAEEAVTKSEEKYRDLVEDSNSIILEFDTTGTITFMNEYGLRFFGYTADELIGRNAIGTIIPEVESTGRDLRPVIEDLLSAPDRYEENVNENITKDGRRVWMSWSNRAITDVEGRVIGNRAIGNDISALKHAEAALQKAHDELEQKVEERTLELQNEIEERKVIDEELRETTEEVLTNINELRRTERSLREQVKRMDVLNRIIHAANESEYLPSLLDTILTTVVSAYNFDFGSVRLLNEAEGVIELQCSYGLSPEFVEWTRRTSIDEPPFDQVYGKGQPYFADEGAKEVLDMSKRAGASAAAAIPLFSKERVIGSIGIGRFDRYTFTEEERSLLLSIGRETGTAIAKVRAEESVKEHARGQEILNRIITEGNESEDLPSLATLVVDYTIDLMDFDAGALFLLNEAEGMIELQYARGYSPVYTEGRERFSIDEPHLVVLYHDHTPLWTVDLEIAPPEIVEREHITAMAMVPLIAGGQIIGNLGISSSRQHQFTEAEKALLVAIGREAGTVIGKMQAEQELRASDEELRNLTAELTRSNKELAEYAEMIDLASDSILVRDLDHRVLSWNKGAERIFGWTKEEAIGQHVPSLLQTNYPIPFDEVNEQVFSSGSWEGEVRCTTKDGAELVIEHHLTLMWDNQGKPVAILSISNDVTNRKQAEEKVRAASLYSRSLLEASLDPLVTISAEGKITDVNKATEDATGFSREELIGSDFSSYFTNPAEAKTGYRKVFTDSFVRDYPLAIQHKSGRITDVLYNAALFTNEAGEIQGVFAAARDITERKRAEEALKRAHDELEQKVHERTRELQLEIEEHKVTEEELRTSTEELEDLTQELRRSNTELEQFAYIASHDLQEPLRTVTSAIGLLQSWYKGKFGAEADTFIGYAVDGTKHMQQLIKDLLAYSRVTSRGESFTPVHCDDVLMQVLDDLKTTIEEGRVKITLPEGTMPIVMGDRTQLVQLFQNLIANAIKFRSEQPPEVQIGVKRDAKRNRWQFSIKDNGIGMEMQYADKVFTIFQRLHTTEQYPGTGLGLALCRKIVERHGGEIWVESALGKGSTFYFTMPSQADLQLSSS